MNRMMRSAVFIRVAGAMALALALSACNESSSNSSSSTAAASAAATDPVAFSASNYSAAQNAGTVSLTVTRTGSAAAAVSVAYATVNGTAVGGTDFTTTTGTLQWAENDSTPKLVTVPISNATPYSGTKFFQVALSDPNVTAQIASPDTATVQISGDATASLGELQLSAPTYAVAQSSASMTVTVNRAAGSSGAVSVNYATSNGTAVAGTDFTAAGGTLEWADGDATSKTFSVAISNAKPFLGGKTFAVALSSPSGGATLGTPVDATVTITGDGSAAVGTFHLSASSYAIGQSAGTLTVNVSRAGGSNGATSVNYATTNGTAIAGKDFTAASGTLKWANGDAVSKSFSIPIDNAAPFSGSKTFTVTLSSPVGGATISNPGSATVTVAGDAGAAVGSLQFATSTYTVAQSAGTLTVSVKRMGGSGGAVTVGYATKSGTAVAGTDFTAAGGTLTWADGDAASKTFSVAVSNATPFSGSKSLNVTLASPAGGATLSSPSSTSVAITGDASSAVGSLQFSAAGYSVAQSAGTVQLTINRTGGSSGALSVAYTMTGGSAVAGTNFTAAGGTANWANGDAASKTISIPISNATPFSGSKSFTVALSSPSGGAALGAPTSATVTISGSSTSGQSAPSGLIMTGQTSNSISLSWTAPSTAAASYKIYRNGASYATSTTTSYKDQNATNATNASGPATTYSYAVAAVDANGNESAQTTDMTFWVYNNGVYNWTVDYSYGCVINYKDTAGGPEEGPYDVSVTALGTDGGFQPVSSGLTPLDDFEGSAFKYIQVDLKPTRANQSWYAGADAAGDIGIVPTFSIMSYGQAPVVGKWATYKIPLSAFNIGKASFTGAISGSTLTVTAVASGVIAPGMQLTGSGIAPGTRILSPSTNGGKGTYQLSNSQSVNSTAIAGNNFALYKFNIIDASGAGSGNVYYLDNMRFTEN